MLTCPKDSRSQSALTQNLKRRNNEARKDDSSNPQTASKLTNSKNGGSISYPSGYRRKHVVSLDYISQ